MVQQLLADSNGAGAHCVPCLLTFLQLHGTPDSLCVVASKNLLLTQSWLDSLLWGAQASIDQYLRPPIPLGMGLVALSRESHAGCCMTYCRWPLAAVPSDHIQQHPQSNILTAASDVAAARGQSAGSKKALCMAKGCARPPARIEWSASSNPRQCGSCCIPGRGQACCTLRQAPGSRACTFSAWYACRQTLSGCQPKVSCSEPVSWCKGMLLSTSGSTLWCTHGICTARDGCHSPRSRLCQ